MTHLDLFSGKGTFIERAQKIFPHYECVGACEIDPFAQQLLLRLVEQRIITSDVRTFPTHFGEEIDLLTGGFPCQDISIAKGKNAQGLNGEKSGLWREMRRIIGGVRPKYVVIENTSALLRRGLDSILADLARMRYDAVWTMLSAAECGYPHRRKRLFVFAIDTDRVRRDALQIYYRAVTEIIRSKTAQRANIQQFGRLSGEGFWREDYAEFLRMDNGYASALNSARLRIIGNAIVHDCVDVVLAAIKELDSF